MFLICSEANPWPLGSLVAVVLSVDYVGDIARAPALALSLALALGLGLGLALALAFALALVLALALALGLRPRPWPCRYPFPLLNCHAQEALTFFIVPDCMVEARSVSGKVHLQFVCILCFQKKV